MNSFNSLLPIFVDWEKKTFRGLPITKNKKKVLKYLNSWIFTSNS